MKNTTRLFHTLSYLQYPMMLVGVFFAYRPVFSDLNNLWADLNKSLIFLGLGISLSTLQDTSKTQNKLSRRIFENPRYARIFLWVIAGQILFFLSIGILFLFIPQKAVSELSFGLIALAIGLIGLLKSAVEMAEKHRKELA